MTRKSWPERSARLWLIALLPSGSERPPPRRLATTPGIGMRHCFVTRCCWRQAARGLSLDSEAAPGPRALRLLLRQHRLARGFKSEGQRFLRYGGHERSDHPAETGRDVSREGDHLALHVDTAVLFLEAPPGFHAPEKTVIFFPQLLALVGFPGIVDFGDMRGAAAAVGQVGSVPKVADVVLGVEHHGDHLLAAEAQEYLETIAIPGLDSRAHHLGRVVCGVAVVVLEHLQYVVDVRSLNKGQTFPVVNHAVRAGNF